MYGTVVPSCFELELFEMLRSFGGKGLEVQLETTSRGAITNKPWLPGAPLHRLLTAGLGDWWTGAL